MEDEILIDLPKPPEHFSDSAIDSWYKTGITLLRGDRLRQSNLIHLEEICYWEDYKNRIRENLQGRFTEHQLEISSGNIGNINTSTLLSNYKAIQDEINELRAIFGLKPELPEHISNTPEIPDEVFDNLPGLLRECCDMIEDIRSRDSFLILAIPVLSIHLPNVQFEVADGVFTPNYFTYIVKSQSGIDRYPKKAIDLASVLNKQALKGDVSGFKVPLIALKSNPGKIQREIFQNLGKGLFFEEYMQVAAGMNSFDVQLFFNLIEKSSLKKPMSLSIENDQNRVLIPEISAAINGTMSEIKTMSEQLGEEYLTNFSFYLFESDGEWKSSRPTTRSKKFNQGIDVLSGKMFELNQLLSKKSSPIFIEPTNEQWQMIDETFSEKMNLIEELDLTQNLQIANEKAVTNTLKLASIFTIIRVYLDQQIDLNSVDVLSPNDNDMIAALWLTDTFMKHAIRLYQNLPVMRKESYRGNRFNRFYGTLPAIFDTSEAVEVAGKLSIPDRTANRYLSELLEKNKLVKLRRGVYKKA
ncbi:MAG: hypothetical protein WD513_01100 [Balneolaceae bacterium]